MAGQKILAGPQLGDTEGIFVRKFERVSRWDHQKEFLVGNWESEVVGETDGGVVGWFERGCHSGKRMDPSLAKMWNGCAVGSVAGVLLRGVETKVDRSCAPRCSC